MSIVILNGKVSLVGKNVINFKDGFKITSSSIRRINHLVANGKAKMVLTSFNGAVICSPALVF